MVDVRSEQAALQQKLAQIEKNITVGGENLLEKAEEQEKLLEESAKELGALSSECVHLPFSNGGPAT